MFDELCVCVFIVLPIPLAVILPIHEQGLHVWIMWDDESKSKLLKLYLVDVCS